MPHLHKRDNRIQCDSIPELVFLFCLLTLVQPSAYHTSHTYKIYKMNIKHNILDNGLHANNTKSSFICRPHPHLRWQNEQNKKKSAKLCRMMPFLSRNLKKKTICYIAKFFFQCSKKWIEEKIVHSNWNVYTAFMKDTSAYNINIFVT